MDAKQRHKYIGGTDAAPILGLSRWSTPLQVWAEKTGQIIPENISDRVSVKLGNKLEQTVAEFFTEETGKKVRRVNKTLFHKDYPFLGANLDREVLGEDAILECKTASAWKSKEWEGQEIPQEYIIQVMHYLAVTGAKLGYIAVLIGNQDFKWKLIERDERMIADMVKREVSFWTDFIIPKVMPGQISSGDSDVLYQLYPLAEPESVVPLDDEANRIIESRNALYQDCILIEKQIAERENELKALLKDKETGKTDLWTVTWKNQAQVRLDTAKIKEEAPDLYKRFGKETQFRKLTIKGVNANGKH
jgi:putative phage-type endonuclease